METAAPVSNSITSGWVSIDNFPEIGVVEVLSTVKIQRSLSTSSSPVPHQSSIPLPDEDPPAGKTCVSCTAALSSYKLSLCALSYHNNDKQFLNIQLSALWPA